MRSSSSPRYTGLRRSELAGLDWADARPRYPPRYVRQPRSMTCSTTPSEDSERIITLDKDRAESLQTWRKTQLAERLAWGAEWTDSGRVFTREDGTPLRPAWISVRFDTLAARAGFLRSPFTNSGTALPPCFWRPASHQGGQRDPRPQHRSVHDGRIHRGR